MKDYKYKYEMHSHTAWGSACGHSTPEEMAAAYYHAGYRGMVITDHFLRGNTAVDRSLPWEDKMRAYWRPYEAARAWAEGKEFTVLFGIEHFYGDGKEVLTYGIDLDFLLRHPDLHQYPLEEYCAAVHEAGGFLSHAHPFRHASYLNGDLPPHVEHMDAIEVFNFYNHDEDNQQAAALARDTGMLTTSGGDEHICTGGAFGNAGVVFAEAPENNEQFVRLLRAGDYKLNVKGKIVEKDWGQN